MTMTARAIAGDSVFNWCLVRIFLCLSNIKSNGRWPGVSRTLFLLLIIAALASLAQAQSSAPISSSGLNTVVSNPVQVGSSIQYNVTGGTRPGGGANLFHSFGEFGVPTSNIANFLNETATPTSNILGRVTGGNPSNIFGTIQTTGFGSANLFLMNPAGIVFGPNASLNVGGSANFTTADYLRLADGERFSAIPGLQDASISSAPVAAFGFLGSNPGAITVQGSQLSVPTGQGISLVGGNITAQGGTLENGTKQAAQLTAPGGEINLASVASPGEVLYPSMQLGPNANGQSFSRMGSITLSEGSRLDASADAAGTVKIRGGQFVVSNSTLSADTTNSNGAPMAVDVQLTGDMSITDTSGVSAITARTTGAGDAGEVRISSSNLAVSSTSSGTPGVIMIDTHTAGAGRAGNVSITTGNINANRSGGGVTLFIDSGFTGFQNGQGGDVAITAKDVVLNGPSINAGDFTALLQRSDGNGSAGNVTIVADTLQLGFASIHTDAGEAGVAGDIAITARNTKIANSPVTAVGFERGGLITIKTDVLSADNALIESGTFVQSSGGVNVLGNVVELTRASTLVSNTGGDGDAGPVNITANDHLTLSGFIRTGPIGRPTGIFSNSFGVVGAKSGDAGTITITTPRLIMTDGARINTTTRSSGLGGDVNINAQSVSLSGEFPSLIPEPLFSEGTIHPGGITTVTTGQNCAGPCGDAGNVSISAGSLIIGSGAHIDSGTRSTGQGGNITVNAQDTISISGTLSNGQPGGMLSRTVGTVPNSGTGGDISLTAGRSVSMSNGASISASSTGPADAGNIAINAGAQFLSQNASVTTEASQASGGNILIQATDAIRLVNSQLSTSVQGGPNTSGGNILLDPAVVTLQNSQVLAQAVQGQGGNINIIAGTFLADQTSVVSASSQFGLSGSVNIQSPVSSLSGSLATLPQRPLQVQHLLRQRCAAQANGQMSSLVVAGRDTLPSEPGGWLLSSLALLSEDVPVSQPNPLTSDGLAPHQPKMIVSGQLYEQSTPSPQQGLTSWAAGCGS